MSDLTIMYLTANAMPESWAKFHAGHLVRAAGSFPIVSSSRQPISIGTNILQTAKRCYWTIYGEMLKLARMAQTPFVAMAEDDVLYTREHFADFRPPRDAVAYNRARWSLYTWRPVYHLMNRLSNAALIAPRDYLIDALEERERKHPQGVPDALVGEVGRGKVDRRLGVTPRNCVEFWSRTPIVHLHHPTGCDTGQSVPGMRKKYGQIQAFDVPYWGKAADLVEVYHR